MTAERAIPSSVRIVEVGPRDGLQNEALPVSVAARVAFIHGLAAAGLPEIEVGSFVSPKWIPQLADTEDVVTALGPPPPGVTYSALVPNLRGLERARSCGIKSIAVFTAASESFSRSNTNASIAETFDRFRPVILQARSEGIRVRGYVSTAFACPFEGTIDPKQSVGVARRFMDLGVDEVSIGDTVGIATPRDVERFLEEAEGCLDTTRIAFHFHDTYGMAVANVQSALAAGASVFDSSAGGVGGCPYAPGAAGNLATEDLLYLLHGSGIATGVDLDRVISASVLIEEQIGHRLPSKVLRARRAARRAVRETRPPEAGA